MMQPLMWNLISPACPEEMDWNTLYPAYFDGPSSSNEGEQGQQQQHKQHRKVEVADVGCGFGGLLFALAPLFPDTLMLGESI
jgi:tRNA (guanine-N7-)-methyltransferase